MEPKAALVLVLSLALGSAACAADPARRPSQRALAAETNPTLFGPSPVNTCPVGSTFGLNQPNGPVPAGTVFVGGARVDR